MHGNLYEWVQDVWREDLGTDPQTDPIVTGGDERRTTKGGSYWNQPNFDRAAVRAGGYPSSSGRTTGFRIARTFESPVAITECGQTVVTDAVLVVDLECDLEGFPAIWVGASNITVDLGGHVISGDPADNGVDVHNVGWVTIKNGTLENLLAGVDISGTRWVRVENLTIRNLVTEDLDDFVTAVNVGTSRDVVVRDCIFEFFPEYHKNGIHFYNSDFIVDNIEMNDGGVGVDINGINEVAPGGSTGSVVNSRFVGAKAGVLVQVTDDARVADNEFLDCEVGVVVDTHVPGEITGLTVEGNSMDSWVPWCPFLGDGRLQDSQQCHPRDSVRHFLGLEHGVSGWAGDRMFLRNRQCDLRQRGDGQRDSTCVTVRRLSGNTWENNICETKRGAEIPPCTAR